MKISKQRYKKLEAVFNDLTRLTSEYNELVIQINAQIETLEDLRISIEENIDYLDEEANDICETCEDRIDALDEDDERQEILENVRNAWTELTDLSGPDDQNTLDEYESSYLSNFLPQRDLSK